MQTIIIHTQTRVIRRLTTDNSPPGPDETAIPAPIPIDLAGGFKKLAPDNRTLLTPTQQEIDDSGVDEERNAILRMAKIDDVNAIIDDIAQNGATLAKIRTYFQKIKALR